LLRYALVAVFSDNDAAILSSHRPVCFPDGDACFDTYLSILSIMKNEAPYLAEWIEYHLLVGVEKFWLVNNDSDDNTEEVLAPYIEAGIVIYLNFTGRGQQFAIYNSLRNTLKEESFWLAIMDIDEFLLPVDGRSVPEILRARECFPAISVNWVMYGSNGQLTKQPGLVIERFKNHTSWDHIINRHIKTIVRPRMVRRYAVHDHIYQGRCRSRDVLRRRNRLEFWDQPPVFDVLRMNHYWTKSREEFQAKRWRGRASIANRKIAYNLWRRVDIDIAARPDVITDDHTIDWAIPLVKENLKIRFSDRPAGNFHVHQWPPLIQRTLC
jgi:glycosyltransferase involved in cell wall biosynthesis